jgi:FkbM family methyltransferase
LRAAVERAVESGAVSLVRRGVVLFVDEQVWRKGAMRTARKHENLIYDVGMHKGEDAELYLKKGFDVVGFEADPDLVRHCRNRFAREIEQGRLVIVEGAVAEDAPSGAERATVTFYRNTDVSVWGTVVQDWARRNEMMGTRSTAIEVPRVDFEASLERYGIPYYLKIDIEGVDTVCLRALRSFSLKPDYVSLEAEKADFTGIEAELELFGHLGYTAFQAVQQARFADQPVPEPAREGRSVPHLMPPGSSGLFGKDLPGSWLGRERLLRKYRRIFLLYRLVGNYSRLRQSRAGRWMIRRLGSIAGRPVPGWYDTHARHSSAGG